ncbi:MAG TPA: cell wall-binding repeat-containing protein, partial [Coriobacteriia bacterium]|nr:cell wall-binding repeat-containing protein [Coriobacteriia bacterium]
VVGDVTAVSPGVASIVDSYVGGVTRLGGDTRYETSAVIAGWALGQGWLDAMFFGLATGENFPDALAGGAVCGYENGPLLLTPPDSLNSAARALMFTQQDVLREIYLFGGSDVLSNQVMTDCAALMP